MHTHTTPKTLNMKCALAMFDKKYSVSQPEWCLAGNGELSLYNHALK